MGRPPELRYQVAEDVAQRLQRVLDALELSPAYVKTPAWDVVAWTLAASAVLTDYAAIPAEQRNIPRLVFCDPRVRAAQMDGENVARFGVAAFRADAARAGAARNVDALVDERCRLSPEFEAMWRDNDVRTHGGGTKQMRHPVAGLIALEYLAFAVDGRADLGMVIYNPATSADADQISSLIKSQPKAARRLAHAVCLWGQHPKADGLRTTQSRNSN